MCMMCYPFSENVAKFIFRTSDIKVPYSKHERLKKFYKDSFVINLWQIIFSLKPILKVRYLGSLPSSVY